MDKIIQLNLNKVKTQLADLKNLASKNNWKYFYDKDLDQLSLSPKVISPEVFLHSLNKEIAIYLDKQSNVRGMFIEYFFSNFAEHEEEFKKLEELLTVEVDGLETISADKSDEASLITDALQGKALADLIKAPEQQISVSAPS